jgi:hypothetical protein
LIPWVLGHRFNVKGLCPLGHIAHQAFAQPETDLAHNGLIEATGCSKHIAVLFVIEQVNATDFGCHNGAHTVNGRLKRRI